MDMRKAPTFYPRRVGDVTWSAYETAFRPGHACPTRSLHLSLFPLLRSQLLVSCRVFVWFSRLFPYRSSSLPRYSFSTAERIGRTLCVTYILLVLTCRSEPKKYYKSLITTRKLGQDRCTSVCVCVSAVVGTGRDTCRRRRRVTPSSPPHASGCLRWLALDFSRRQSW